jgi:GDP-mannose 6-dehydrogenase
MEIALLGAGRVGLISALGYVRFGHVVTLIDIDVEKMTQIQDGRAPFLEEGLRDLLLEGLASGNLHVKSQLEGCPETFLICLPTPSLPNGEADLSHIKEAFISIEKCIASRGLSPLIILRSTVPPLATRLLFEEHFKLRRSLPHLVLNPEFLREGSAIDDFFNPPFCVAGGDDPQAVERALSLYGPLQCPKYGISLESAALLKYACNAFHALKISFANEIGRLAPQMQADGEEVMRLLASDAKLNASPAYLKPGFAFGGPCLSKDLQSLLSIARSSKTHLPLLENIFPSNETRLKSCVDAIISRGANRIGMIGVSFKRGTGDLRNSPYMQLAKLLEAQHVSVQFYDAEVSEFAHTEILGQLLDLCDLITVGSHSLTPTEQQRLTASGLPILELEQIGLK